MKLTYEVVARAWHELDGAWYWRVARYVERVLERVVRSVALEHRFAALEAIDATLVVLVFAHHVDAVVLRGRVASIAASLLSRTHEVDELADLNVESGVCLAAEHRIVHGPEKRF